MLNKKVMILAILLVSLLAIGAVNAADNNANDTEMVSANGNDEIVSVENDLDVLSADEVSYSTLSDEISRGGNIELQHDYYTYSGSGSTIVIGGNRIIDGKGAVIDMAGSNIQTFFVDGSGVTINNLTIKNANYAGYGGGAIEFKKGNGTVSNCNFVDNSAWSGGAIYFRSSGTVENCKFTNNSATSAPGGAIRFGSAGTVTNCNFTNNIASQGGAVFFVDNGTVTNCNFIGNNATFNGGAVWMFSGSVENCNFVNNTASTDSGAIRMYSGTVTNCNFTDNSANGDRIVSGGAIWMFSGSVENCDFVNNTASTNGGAVYFNSNGAVTNCNFTDNSAGYGGAIEFNGKGTVTSSNFVDNSVTSQGGAIRFRGTGTVTNSNFTGNNATKGPAIFFSNHSGTNGISESCFLNNRRDIDSNSSLNVVQNGNNIEITFRGQENLLNAIYSEGSPITVTDVIYWGANGIANRVSSATLTESNNKSGQNITLEIYDSVGMLVENVTLVTDENGRVAYDYNSFEDGKYGYVAFHPDDLYYSYVKVTGNFIRKNVPDITINRVSSITYGETLVVNVKLSADVERRAVVTIGNESKYVSLKDGKGSVEFKGLTGGLHTIIASYNGDNKYNKVFTTKTVNVKRAHVKINVTADNIKYGEDLTVNVKLSNDVARRAVVTIENETKLVSLTNGSGSVKFKGLAAGTHSIIVYYNGDINYFRGDSVNKTVKVYRSDVDIKVTANNITFGKDLVVKVKLSKDVARRAVVTIGNETKLVSLTDGSGSVKFKDLALGNYTIIVSYNGDSNYIRGTTVNKTVTVSKGPANIKVTVNNNNPVRHREPLTIDVLLPNATRRVSITIENESKFVSLINGRGTVNFDGLDSGIHTIIASYDGDSNYIKSSVKTTLNIRKSATEFSIEYFKVIYTDTITINLKFPADVTKRAVVTVNNETKYVSLKEGLATVEFTGLSTGTYNIDVSYDGDVHYNPEHLSAQFEVKI